jgi:hypothetical protein
MMTSRVSTDHDQVLGGSRRSVAGGLSCILACVLVSAATDASAQGRRGGPAVQSPTAVAPLPSDPLTGPVVTNAPYSGDAVTTVTQILGDGTRIEQRTEAKFYRDSAGRIRREQMILGLPALNRAAAAQTLVTIDPTPDGGFAYTLDPVARTARRVPRKSGAFFIRTNTALGQLAGNGFGAYTTTQAQGYVTALRGTPLGARQGEESLGTRQIEGVRATGRRTTSTIPTGQIGNDRPIEITEEAWESPDLRVLIYSRFSDPRTGVVEYKLMNISRTEPPADLFAVPADYTILEVGAPGVRGGRTAAPGARGPQ